MSRQHRPYRTKSFFWFHPIKQTKYKTINHVLHKQNKNGKWVTFTSRLER